jgi:hypothetical protein
MRFLKESAEEFLVYAYPLRCGPALAGVVMGVIDGQ